MENYIRQRTKSELKKLYTNLKNKDITDSMMSDLIEACYNENFNGRSSGFDIAADTDAVIAFDTNTRLFSLTPFDPVIEGFKPRFCIFTWAEKPVFHRIFEQLTLYIPTTEGLYLIYIDIDTETGLPKLSYRLNPTMDEIKELLTAKVSVASIYWDAVNSAILYFGDDRHGSEWSPQIHWYLHNAIGARRKSGLYFQNMIVNGDGSSNDHARFSIKGGVMLHDDFELTIPDSEIEIPILNFYTNHVARFAYYTGFSVWKGNNRLCYNANQTHAAEAASGNFVIYHYFATNDILPPNGDGIHRKIISVMGAQEYTSLGAAYLNNDAELAVIMPYMPQQGRCYIGSVIFQTADEYTNTIKARVVGLVGNEKSHPPVTIAADSKTYLEIDDKQELRLLPGNLPAGADGRGIVSITLTSVVGLEKTYTITYTDATTSTFTVNNGAPGANGRGIASIVLHSTVGKVKTYRITYTDATYFDYDVTDGADGTSGSDTFQIDFIFDVAGTITYPCAYALKWTAMIHQQANAPTLSHALDTDLAQYTAFTVTADAAGIVTLTGTWL